MGAMSHLPRWPFLCRLGDRRGAGSEGRYFLTGNAFNGAGGDTERRRDGFKFVGREVETQTQHNKLTQAMRKKEPGE